MTECYLRPHDTFSLVGRDLVPSWVDRKALGLGRGAVGRRYKVGMHFRAESTGYVVVYSAMAWAVRGEEMGVRSSKTEMTRGEGILYWSGACRRAVGVAASPHGAAAIQAVTMRSPFGSLYEGRRPGCDDLGRKKPKSPRVDACMAAARYNNASMVQAKR